MKKAELEWYTDYLLGTFGVAAATGLPEIVNGEMSHDQVMRSFSERECTSKDLWLQVESTVRQIERDDGVLKSRPVQQGFYTHLLPKPGKNIISYEITCLQQVSR